MVKKLLEYKFLICILIFSFFIRLVLINQSFWLDESIGAIEVRNGDLVHILTQFSKFDNHPPLYYVLLEFWTSIFGYSEISIRMPSVLFGVACIFLVFKICEILSQRFGKRDKVFKFMLASVLFLSNSQLHIYYSQEARMYSMTAFFSSLAIYSFITSRWFLYSFSITFLYFTDYLPLVLFPVFVVDGFLEKKPKNWWFKFFLSHLPVLILGIFWLKIFLIQLNNGRWLVQTLPEWKKIAGGANLKEVFFVWSKFVFGRISLIDKSKYLLLVFLASIPFVFSLMNAFRHKEAPIRIIWFWFFLSLLLGFLISFFIPAFTYFRFIFLLPSFYILVSYGIYKIKRQSFQNFLIFTILAFNFLSWLIYIRDPRQQREKWREAVGFIERRALPGDIVLFEYPDPFTPFRWYSRSLVEAKGATDSVRANVSKTKERTEKLIENKDGIYLFEYLRDLSDPTGVVQKTISEKGFKVKEEYAYFQGIGKITYWIKNDK